MEEIKTVISVEKVANGFILSSNMSESKNVAKSSKDVKEYISGFLTEVDLLSKGSTAIFTIDVKVKET